MIRIITIFAFLLSFSVLAQKDNIAHSDALLELSKDSLAQGMLVNPNVLISKVDSASKRNFPKKVLIRSLLIPGWGQASNRDYWVIPIVYAAATGGVLAIRWNQQKYVFYKSYLSEFVVDNKTEVYIPQNGTLTGPFVKAQIEPAVKAYHRQRDLSIVAFALGWTLQAIQANVSAHLKGFDMSDNITLQLKPNSQQGLLGNINGVSLCLRF